MSKLASVFGLFAAIAILGLGTYDFDKLVFIDAFLNWQALAVVLGGTFAAVLMNYPMKQVGCVFKGFFHVFIKEVRNKHDVIEQMVEMSYVVKRKGIVALEQFIEETDDHFMKVAVSDMLIYSRQDELENALSARIASTRYHQQQCIDVYSNMAAYAPAFGMLGTVMGLIIMMTTQGASAIDPFDSEGTSDMMSSLLTGMGLALVTTFYGVLFANFFFLPIAGKLQVLSDEETMRSEMIVQGVLSIHQDDKPLLVREKLMMFMTQKQREILDREAPEV